MQPAYLDTIRQQLPCSLLTYTRPVSRYHVARFTVRCITHVARCFAMLQHPVLMTLAGVKAPSSPVTTQMVLVGAMDF